MTADKTGTHYIVSSSNPINATLVGTKDYTETYHSILLYSQTRSKIPKPYMTICSKQDIVWFDISESMTINTHHVQSDHRSFTKRETTNCII